jgi:branched-subunit amino acid aminotransferase/4-amino-4-deoxychorismate lyase
MSFVCFNESILPTNQFADLLTQRGFLYGDGFFETCIIKDHRFYFFNEHVHRMQEASETLDLKGFYFNEEMLWKNILAVWNANHSPSDAILKLMVWRKEGGLYEPLSNEAHALLELKPLRHAPTLKQNWATAHNIHNHYNPLSSFKSLSAAHYVVAGIEKKKRNLDEIILCDEQGHLSEALSSNLFWIHDQQVYTPSLETGCVHGISRRAILKICKSLNIPFNEVKVKDIHPNDLYFTANVTGLSRLQTNPTSIENENLFTQLQNNMYGVSFQKNLI